MNMPSRKNIRLANWDYSNRAYYHVTICTNDRLPILCTVNDTSHEVRLSDIGACVNDAIDQSLERYPSTCIETFVIMPNHVHLLVALNGSDVSLSRFIGFLKSHATRQVRKTYPGLVLWQRSYYDHIIRDEKDYHDTWQYISENPRKWKSDDYYV